MPWSCITPTVSESVYIIAAFEYSYTSCTIRNARPLGHMQVFCNLLLFLFALNSIFG